MGFTTYEAFYVAHAAMVLLTWFPTVALFFCTFCMVRRKRDPARTGFTYLKLAFPFFAAFLFFDICAYACAVAYTRWWRDVGYSSSDYDENVLKSLILAQSHTWAVARLFDCMADIVVFIVLERLATGVVIAKAGVPDKIGTIAKYASYGIAVLLAALNFAQFGLRERFNIEYYVGDFFDGTGHVNNTTGDALTKSTQVEFSFQVLVFVLSLAIVGRSIMVKMQSRTEPRVANASNFVLAASVLWLLRCVYNMAAIASLTNLSNAFENSKERKHYWDILDVVFAIWPQFVLLCLVFFLGRKKGNGLWSTEQPFMKVTSGQQQTPWGYGYDQQQPQYAPPVQQTAWQSQDQQQQQYQQEQQNQQYQQQYQQQYHQQQPAYAPQQHQNGYQQPYQDPQTVSSYSTTPVQTRSPPPPHEDTIGLNHQANGTPPQGPPQPYNEKAY